MPAEGIAFSDVAVRQRAREKARALHQAQQAEQQAAAEPDVALPQPVDREDMLKAQAGTGRSAYPQKLARQRYRYALSRERYQLDQASALQNTASRLLAACVIILPLCYVFSLPEYFLFYLFACLAPLLFAVTLVLATLCYRRVYQPCLPPVETTISATRWVELLSDAESIKNAQIEHRARLLDAAHILLYVSLAVLLFTLILGVCIGA